MLSKKFPEGTKKSGWRGAAATTCRLAWGGLSPPPEPIQHERRHQKPNKEDRLKPVLLLRRKGAAASRSARRVGILEDESWRMSVSSYSSVVPFKYRKLFRIDEEARARIPRKSCRGRGLRVQPHGIGEAGTAAPCTPTRRGRDIGSSRPFRAVRGFSARRVRSGGFFPAMFALATSVAWLNAPKPADSIAAKQGRSPPRRVNYKGSHERLSSHEKLSATPFRGRSLSTPCFFSSSRRWRP